MPLIQYGQFEQIGEELTRITEASDVRITEAGDIRITNNSIAANAGVASIVSEATRIPFSAALYVKASGVWKLTTPYVNYSGVWKQPESIYIKISGNWKRVY
jgi:hypothetical protein